MIVIVVAIIWHFLLEKMWPATMGSTISATIASWSMLTSHFGWLDETFYKNISITIAVSFTASLIIGIIFTVIRKNNEKEKYNNTLKFVLRTEPQKACGHLALRYALKKQLLNI